MNTDDKTCAEDFKFLTVVKQNGLQMLRTPGLVGLGPRHTEEAADLFIERMKQ